MKHLLVILSFLLVTASNTALLAQESTSQAESQEAVPTEDANDSQGHVSINFDENSEEKIEKITAVVKKVFGDEVGSELELELKGLSEEEKKEIADAIENDLNFSFGGNGSGMGFWESLVALTAIVLIFGMPIIILGLVLFFGSRKRRQKMDLVKSFLDSGQQVPEQMLAEFSTSGKSATLRSGLTLSAVGLGLLCLGAFNGNDGLMGVAMIPFFIGVARLVFWKFDNQAAA